MHFNPITPVTFSSFILLGLTSLPLLAGTVVITSVPDEAHELQPLTSLNGMPLAPSSEIRVGAFPGLNDDQILDLAWQGGLAQVTASFVSFGSPCFIGQGVDGLAGGFEIAVKDTGTAAPWAGQTVSLLIQTAGGEFLVARFAGKIFEAESATGLEPLLSLHLADANVIVGGGDGKTKLATSAAPCVGSFGTWLAGFPAITEPALKLSGADADSDGRSNFLEYATGGDPASSVDPPPCWVQPDAEGGFWIRFKRVTGVASIHYSFESSADPAALWTEDPGTIEQDPEGPFSMRLHLPGPVSESRFFRLKVESGR
jgi:hypothetical protein